MLAGQADDRTLPAGPLAIPLAEIARNFQVSRTHVLRLLRDAETAGFLAREGAPDRLRFLPPLVDALQNMFATLFLFMGGNACRAVAEARGARRD
jgi:DNA-binding IclR family transcriptional regulator